MKYIDFDGVIMDTDPLLFSGFSNFRERSVDEKINHIQNANWEYIIRNSLVINDAINIIKSLDDITILTTVHSMENEGVAKIKFLREMGIECDIILSPYLVKKTDVVNAYGNILVDDALFNLEDWERAGGRPILFNKDGFNFDRRGRENKKYARTRTLEILRRY